MPDVRGNLDRTDEMLRQFESGRGYSAEPRRVGAASLRMDPSAPHA
jgi:hypothetical protein